MVPPVESGMVELDGVAGLSSVEDDELPVPEIVIVLLKVYVSVPVMVVMPGTVKVRVSVVVVCDVIVADGPRGEV